MPTYPAPQKQADVPAPSPAPSSPLKSNSPAPSILPNLSDPTAKKIRL